MGAGIVRMGVLARAAVKRAWAWGVRQDWRIWAILFAMAVAVVSTWLVYKLQIWQDPATHMGAVFASWVGGVALFVVIGSIVSFVSLAQPEKESFDARARILFRRQYGKHIDYIISRMGQVFGHYSEVTLLRITIREYDRSTQKFRIEIYQNARVRGYIDDIATTYKSEIAYTKVTLPPPAERKMSS